ncbi:hypothetical protein INR49_002060 [Caranx melampygus]|nr:hypothetical protein INR49_002060 [Caranx melampygus]
MNRLSFSINLCSVFSQPLRVRVFGALKIPMTSANRRNRDYWLKKGNLKFPHFLFVQTTTWSTAKHSGL